MAEAARRRDALRPWTGSPWTTAELALLGTAPDEVIARRIGRTVFAVRILRARRKIRKFNSRGRGFKK
jgi:hypothetical protein